MSSRDRILKALRTGQSPFDDAAPRPESYLPVARFDQEDLVTRFTAEFERINGKAHIAADTEAAIQIVLDLVGSDNSVLAWEDLPLPGLAEALAAHKVQMAIPRARRDDRATALAQANPIRMGITGADAGLAATGTLVLVTRAQQGRLPSLLPPVHVALLRRNRLFPRLEAWMAAEGRIALQTSNSIAFVSGPSRTADIEMQSIQGVHGPGEVHAVIF